VNTKRPPIKYTAVLISAVYRGFPDMLNDAKSRVIEYKIRCRQDRYPGNAALPAIPALTASTDRSENPTHRNAAPENRRHGGSGDTTDASENRRTTAMRTYMRHECQFTGLLNAVPSLEEAKELFIVAADD
jgi:hypothetical protein